MKEPEENIVYAKKIRDQLYLRLMRFHVSMQTSSQDTDSFIIGQRVYVDGVKPGRIQFIGETKFGKLAKPIITILYNIKNQSYFSYSKIHNQSVPMDHFVMSKC